jgi:hypothetical protein
MRFSIRDLMFVTVIVALAVGWAIDHWQYSAGDRDLLRQIKEEHRKSGEWQSYPPMSDLPTSSAPAPISPKK